MHLIKFRGQRLEDGKWVYGYYCVLNGNNHRIYTGYAEKDVDDLYPEFYTVIPETVSQCTGLIDKNGTYIFKDDIVKLFNNVDEIYIVKFDKCCFYLDGDTIVYDMNDDFDKHEIEVIGNIHDNPKMAKGE